ncbi:hypothetical protein QC761_506410 [Podospora bellae-mahoneyi]|uniref:Glycoside Hydrolase Family 5 n=1 Tax=Podospora bellae-mahoneyi TaxID=2093777 RepID=A0ABR0FGR8_9PEZI|nr:hypothetical protein QC761_506410 [Podospora bellae-mahoneyi]
MAYLLFWILAFAAITVTASDNPLDTILPLITWAGVNWPLSRETMIPEGLEHASADSILDRIASAGFNFIRMPYAIEMIDLFYLNNQTDTPFPQTLISALGPDNGALITSQILLHNPIWTRNTTLFKIWSDIVRVAARKNLYIHPDAHVSKAEWCCSQTDGNAWFGDEHFDIENLTRGLGYVAE